MFLPLLSLRIVTRFLLSDVGGELSLLYKYEPESLQAEIFSSKLTKNRI